MHHNGIPPKFIKLIQDLYEPSSCQVIHNGKLSESFEMSTGIQFHIMRDWGESGHMQTTCKQHGGCADHSN